MVPIAYTHWCTAVYEWVTVILTYKLTNVFLFCDFSVDLHMFILRLWYPRKILVTIWWCMCIRPRCRGLTDTKLYNNVSVNCRNQVKHLNYFRKLCVTSTAKDATADCVNSWWAKSAFKLQQSTASFPLFLEQTVCTCPSHLIQHLCPMSLSPRGV